MWRSRKRKRKTAKVNSVPVQVPLEEDWEQEIEEFSHRMKEKEKEKEMSNKTPYGNLTHRLCALCLLLLLFNSLCLGLGCTIRTHRLRLLLGSLRRLGY